MLGSRRALAAALATSLVASPASPAWAQPKPSSNKPPQEVAGDLVKQAITKSQAGDHLGAIDLYLSAYSLIPQHALLSNIGNEYQQAGKPIEALKYFLYLDKDPTGTNATYAQSKAKALQIELGNKNLDDQDVCKPPREQEPEPPAPPPPPPRIVAQEGGGGTGLKYTGITLGVLGLAAIGVGSYYGVKALQAANELTGHPKGDAWTPEQLALQESGPRAEKLQIGLTIAGGVLAGTGIILYVVGKSRSRSPEQVTVAPTATRDSAGLSLSGAF